MDATVEHERDEAAIDRRTERALRDYGILPVAKASEGGPHAPADLPAPFQDLVKLARILCGAPMAFLTFVGDDAQWLLAREGLGLRTSARDTSFCAHAMAASEPLVVPDARRDPRFAANPFVTGEPFIRFYAGAPLLTPDGVPLGALCVADAAPREGLTPDQMFGLIALAKQTMALLEARVSAEERELVAQELSHRVKNTFLVIAGLIGLYARSHPAVRPFATEMRERIAALGRAHNLVRPHSRHWRGDGFPTTLHAMFQTLFAPYAVDGRARIALSGDDLAIDERAATPFALLLHELATNSSKYGALSADGGHVTVTTRRTADHLSILWKEEGGPPAEQPPAEGFGTRVSRLAAEAQLGGTLRRVWDRNGLRVEIEIPLSSVAREVA